MDEFPKTFQEAPVHTHPVGGQLQNAFLPWLSFPPCFTLQSFAPALWGYLLATAFDFKGMGVKSEDKNASNLTWWVRDRMI